MSTEEKTATKTAAQEAADRGKVSYAKRDYENAIREFTEAIRLDNSVTVYFGRRGFVYSKIEDYDNAIKDYTDAIKLDPNNSDYLMYRGDSYYQKKDYYTAINDYTAAIKLDPLNTTPSRKRVDAYQKLRTKEGGQWMKLSLQERAALWAVMPDWERREREREREEMMERVKVNVVLEGKEDKDTAIKDSMSIRDYSTWK